MNIVSRISLPSKEEPMPNHKQRRKKGGRNKSKKVRAMRLSVEARRGDGTADLRGRFKKGLADQPDRQAFKPGSANDLYSRKAA
jgi:hypothetical protein